MKNETRKKIKKENKSENKGNRKRNRWEMKIITSVGFVICWIDLFFIY